MLFHFYPFLFIDFVLEISVLLVSYSIEPINSSIFGNYISLLGGVSVLLNQGYTSMYYLDINFIHKLFFLREDYQYFVDKKLRLNML